MYRVQTFATLAGVTVRALHHYDRLGLLKPARTAAGYRVYSTGDLARLEQIVALKFLGVPLRGISAILDRPGSQLADSLRSQRTALEEKRRLLDAAIRAISQAESELAGGSTVGPSLWKKIIEVIEMQNNSDWTAKYFNEEARATVQARKAIWTPELQAQAEKDWSDLFRDILESLDEDPAGPKAQALVDRWNALVRAFTGGDPQVAGGVKRLWSDKQNWPADFAEKARPYTDPRVWEFFKKAVAARSAT